MIGCCHQCDAVIECDWKSPVVQCNNCGLEYSLLVCPCGKSIKLDETLFTSQCSNCLRYLNHDALIWKFEQLSRLRSSGLKWDLFISYASEDADLARSLAARIIRAGLVPWFADYSILLDELDDFEAAIELGIQRSSHGILLVSSSYLGKEWPEQELEHITEIAASGGIQPIVVLIDIDQAEFASRYSTLANYSSLELIHFVSLDELTQVLLKHFGDRIEIDDELKTEPSQTRCIRDYRLGIEFDLPNHWHRSAENWILPIINLFRFRYDHSKRELRNMVSSSGYFRYRDSGFLLNYQAGEIRPKELQRFRPPGNLSEREILQHQRSVAVSMFAEGPWMRGELPFGLHLLQAAGTRHFAFSYVPVTGKLNRKYSVIVPDRQSERFWEIVFTASLGPDINEFFLISEEVDQIIASIRSSSNRSSMGGLEET